MLFGPVEPAQLEIRPIDEIAENGNGERVDGGCDKDFAVCAVKVRTFNLLANCVRPVEHIVVIINCQTARLS